MMEKVRMLISLKRVSIFLIVLPYLTFNYVRIIHSPFFSLPKLMVFLFGLITIDILIRCVINLINKNKQQTFSLLTGAYLILLFYGFYFTNYIQKIISENLGMYIRGRTIIEIGVIIILFQLYLLRNVKISFKYFNCFLLVFSLITFTTSFENDNEKKVDKLKKSYIHIVKKDSILKPVILIISDEYTSPVNLFKIYKDSNIYHFSNHLSKNGWIIKDSFFSFETNTVLSLGSLFNFNLSRDKKNKNQVVEESGALLLKNASLIDSLNFKNIKIINLGIFNIGKNNSLNFINLYPKTFFEDILFNTTYFNLKRNTGNFKLIGFTNSFYPMQLHNKYILNNLVDTLNKNSNSKTFAYVHLYMPHSPMQFDPEFTLKKDENLNNYLKYWHFTNAKIKILLEKLITENKFRIILTGDHGFRGDKRINAHYTFAAFYGFDKYSLESIKSVQDLGSLVNSGF